MRKSSSVITAVLLVLGTALFALPTTAAVGVASRSAEASKAAVAFESFKALEGTWQGENEHGAATVTYSVVAGGSAVLERLALANHDEMLTVYHLDGDRLLLTHYCVAGNQPRMEARRFGDGKVSFEMIDSTSLGSPEAWHMHRALFRFEGPDRLVSTWISRENGADAGTVVTRLTRVDRPTPSR